MCARTPGEASAALHGREPPSPVYSPPRGAVASRESEQRPTRGAAHSAAAQIRAMWLLLGASTTLRIDHGLGPPVQRRDDARLKVVIAAVDPVGTPESLIPEDRDHCGEQTRMVVHSTQQDHPE